MTTAQPAATIAAALRSHGCTLAFGVPGGGPNLDLIGALAVEGIDFVLGHSETSACIMAAAHGYVSGVPSPAIVTRGPGATAAANGAAQATLDRHPLVLITDTVPQASATRVSHQRLDQRALMHPITKHSATISAAASHDQVNEVVGLAIELPGGTVHLDYDATASESTLARPDTARPPVAKHHDPQLLSELLTNADRPVVIVGGLLPGNEPAIRSALQHLGAPVLSTYHGAGHVAADSPLHAGLFTNGASERPLLDQADLIVLVGFDAVEPIPKPWTYDAPVVSLAVVPTTEPYVPIECEVVGPPGELAALLTESPAGAEHTWGPDAGQTHHRATCAQLLESAPPFGPVAVTQTVAAIEPDAIATVDAGAHFLAVMPFWPVRNGRELLISNGLATMGYAVPAAIGAALHHRDRRVIAFVGDGGLSMTMAELETIARLGLAITVVVFNDSALSLIEIKQQPGHGGSGAVRYQPTDFAAIARAQGVDAATVTNVDELATAVRSSTATTAPLLIDAHIDPSHYPHLLKVTRG